MVLSDSDASQQLLLTANYEWFVDNVSVQNGSSNTLEERVDVQSGQSVYVMVTPFDGVEGGTPIQFFSDYDFKYVTSGLSSVTITPDPATAGQDDLRCDA